MSNKKFILIMSLIVLVGSFIRLYNLGKIPNAAFRDEAALGYNSYSIWKTGRDEYGLKLPIVFRSFEVFFLPAYIYLSAPLVGIFGLSVLITRLLSSLSGIALIVITAAIVWEIWKEKHLCLISALILGISPWHIFYSRGAFEGNLALTFFSLGFLLWLKFLKSESGVHFFLSLLMFNISMYSYQAERFVIPFFLFTAFMLSFSKVWKLKSKLLIPLVINALLLHPLLSISFKAGGYSRAANVSIFSQKQNPPDWEEGKPETFFTNNKIYLRTRQIAALYLSYYSPRNLFFNSDSFPQRSVVNFSVFYAWMFPFLIIGIINLLKSNSLSHKLLIVWLILAPLPAALTTDPFHTYRSLLLYLPMVIIISVGIIKSKLPFKLIVVCTAGLSAVSLTLFWFNYSTLNQIVHAKDWDYGYSELVRFTSSLPIENKIVVNDPQTTPYIHFLFFGKEEPALYQQAVNKLGPLDNYYYSFSEKIRPLGYRNFEFRHVDWRSERGDSGTIFVMAGTELPESEFVTDPNVKLIKEILYPDRSIAFRIVRII